MKKSTVRFERLRSVLEGIGFQATREHLGWRFEHAASGAELIFRRYRPTDFVYAIDLFKVQSHLDWRGLMTPEAFESSLTKTPA